PAPRRPAGEGLDQDTTGPGSHRMAAPAGGVGPGMKPGAPPPPRRPPQRRAAPPAAAAPRPPRRPSHPAPACRRGGAPRAPSRGGGGGRVVEQMASTGGPAGATDGPAIRPFAFEVPQAELDDLRRRVDATKWPEQELVADASQGVRLATTQKLARYWTNGYDWR